MKRSGTPPVESSDTSKKVIVMCFLKIYKCVLASNTVFFRILTQRHKSGVGSDGNDLSEDDEYVPYVPLKSRRKEAVIAHCCCVKNVYLRDKDSALMRVSWHVYRTSSAIDD